MTLSFSAQRRVKLLKQGSTILQSFADPMNSLPRMQRALTQRKSLHTLSLKDQDEFIFSTFHGEALLRKDAVQPFWNPIFNAAVRAVEKPDRKRRVGQYTLANRLLTSYMERSDS